MMRRLSQYRDAPVGVNMTPMIDIVFILLIFFMVLNSSSKAQYAELSLPTSRVGVDLSPGQVRAKLVFSIDPVTEQILLDGRPHELEQAANRIALALQYNPNLNVVIRNHQEAACGATGGRLLAVCARLGVQTISLAVLRDTENGDGGA